MEQSKRIAIFSLAYSPFAGGAEIAVKEITGRLKSLDFTCFTCRFGGSQLAEEHSGNMKVVRLPTCTTSQVVQKIGYIFRAWQEAEKRHKEQPFDAIWGIMAAYAGAAALLFKLRHPRVPFLLTLQEGDSESHILKRVGVFYPLWRMIFKKADYIQAISNYLADFARRHGAGCPIEVVPNGVDLRKFIPHPSKICTSCVRLNQSLKGEGQNPKFTIITTSRLVHKNGIDILIRAIAELRKHQLPVTSYQLLILGGGPEETKLKKLAKDLGVENEVIFLGQVEPDKIPGYLFQADIFVRPSRSEGLGTSFLEAMAAGLPVIGTNVGGIPDFLKDGETGLFVKADDPKDLAEKIALLAQDNNLRKHLSENGRSLVLEKYSWDQLAKRMENIFSKMIVKSGF